MQHSAEYKASATQAYNTAQLMLNNALNNKKWTAAAEQSNDFRNLPPAIILDVDETVLDNSPFEVMLMKTGRVYELDSWHEWCFEKRATPVPGALEFCNYAAAKGVTVFYVTNRRDTVKEATRVNLAATGFPMNPDIETVLTRSKSSDKSERRSFIAEKYRILLLIGDNNGDFYSGFTHASQTKRDSLTSVYADNWGTKWIVLPNPSYGDWEGALLDYNYALPESEKLKVKFGKLME